MPPVARLHTLLDARDRDHILRRLEALRPDSARQWGRMSCAQMICHVSDELRLSLGDLSAQPTGGLLARTLVRFVALYTPVRTPKGVVSAPEFDQEKGGTPPSDFARDRQSLVTLVDRFARSTQPRPPAHPFFGSLTLAEWGRFHFKHMDHHLRQFGA